jgi:hypothetical protein
MPQMLPDGATILPTDMSRIVSGLVELRKTKNAGTSVTVSVNLKVHYEYPKHVTVGGKVFTVNNAIEESNVMAGRKPNHRHLPLPTKARLELIGARLKKLA